MDQLSHALQTAGQAVAAGADDELVLAALLHDVGRAAALAGEDPSAGHDVVGRRLVTRLLGERAGWLVGAHAEAKRCLVATDPAYRDRLSPTSVRSLGRQGGSMSGPESAAFLAHPWAADALRLRRWDDAAKVPGAPAPSIDELLPVYERVRRSHRALGEVTSPDRA